MRCLLSTYAPRFRFFPHMPPLEEYTRKMNCLLLSYILHLISFVGRVIFMERSMEDKKKFRPDPNLKLMDQVREVLRYHHYAYRTEQTYCDWIKRYLKFYGMQRHPREMGAGEVERYLSDLATRGKVAASTQRQALNAIVFLYREVLDIKLGEIAPLRSKKQRSPPTVLTQEEVRRVLRNMDGTHRLMAQLL